jgi:hypothetical protein
MRRVTYRDLKGRYWKSPFGKRFRRAGSRWEFLGDSILGFVKTFYHEEFEDAPSPKTLQVAEARERHIRSEQAKKGAQTKKANRLAERRREQELLSAPSFGIFAENE